MASSTPESVTAESIEAVLAIDGWRGGPPDTRRPAGPRTRRGVATAAGVAIMAAMLLMAGLGPVLYPGDPFAMQGKR